MDNHSFQRPSSSPEKNSQAEQQKEELSSSDEQLQSEKELFKEVGEMIEGVDTGAEMSSDEVNENVKEGKKNFTGGSGTAAQTTSAKVAKQITPPSLEVMRTQIGVKIKKEIIVLEKEAARIVHSSNFNPFQLNSVVAKIRDLKEILANLSYATLETLKSWWFKYVKGITST